MLFRSQGGLAGVFKGGKQDPVRVSTDQNTAATMQNSAVMAALTAILAAGMGVAAPSLQSGAAGAAGVLGISIPSISAPAKMSASTRAGKLRPLFTGQIRDLIHRCPSRRSV